MLTRMTITDRAHLADVLAMLRAAAEFGYAVEDAATNYLEYYKIVGPVVWDHAVAIVTAEFPPDRPCRKPSC